MWQQYSCLCNKSFFEKVAGQVLVIGEAAKAPGNAVVAVNDAFEAALQI